jgi:accessory gene regulator protein AgrB
MGISTMALIVTQRSQGFKPRLRLYKKGRHCKHSVRCYIVEVLFFDQFNIFLLVKNKISNRTIAPLAILRELNALDVATPILVISGKLFIKLN